MSKAMTYKETRLQSEAVFKQFGETKWIPFAKENFKLPHKDANALKGCGLGKFLVSAAMGASLEGHIDALKKYREKFDLVTCDKGFGALVEHGVKPDYVIMCDANIEYKWIKDYIEHTKDVKLICTPYANPEWTTQWKGERYYFVNKDSIETEDIFQPLIGHVREIPAGSNVSNAMVIFFMGCDEISKVNWSGYESIFLTGYDYSWRPMGNYYAWSDPQPKRFYMNHITMLDINKDWVFTSMNLHFSARWMSAYNQAYDMPIVNCSDRGILPLKRTAKLDAILENINKSNHATELVKIAHANISRSRQAYEESVKIFNKTREGLIKWQ